MDRTPQTLLEAVTFFADPERAHQYAVLMRWPNGLACPRYGCGSASVQAIPTRRTWRCKECKRTFSAKVGTIFEDSPIPFTKWLPAFWLLSSTKNGTSSCELARALGVTQKTAWFMFHRIRAAMKTGTFDRKFTGEVEADETFVGGKAQNRRGNSGARRGAGTTRADKSEKAVVFGVVQRDPKGKTRVRAQVVADTKARTLLPALRDHVAFGATVYTDASLSYQSLGSYGFKHQVIDHARAYVEGRVTTNRIENFWSCLKRTLAGTYISVRPFHLDAYLDEQMFRFNEREGNDGGRFVNALKGADGKRLTYAALTASHPLWRLKPGRSARAAVRRALIAKPPISGVSNRLGE
jgi:transposase-like protein